jgi:cell wall-associated NlpC family hydrolase
LGGTDKNGIDCSGFVMMIYKKVFNIRLPRTTHNQIQFGAFVHPDRLQTGDLVFFLPRESVLHVGIYLSNGEFVHISARKSVVISRMTAPYWTEAYKTSRRILSTRQTAAIKTVDSYP